MKQWIALLVSFMLATSAIVTNAVINPADKIRGGEGKGKSEEVDSVGDLATLFANLPTAADYYAYFSEDESAEAESIFKDGFKPVTLDTTSDFVQYDKTYYNGGARKEIILDCTDKEKLPDINDRSLAQEYNEYSTTAKDTDYYKLNRKMEIHYLADGILLSADATLTTGDITYETVKKYRVYGYGDKQYIVETEYERNEDGTYKLDDNYNRIEKTDVPDASSPYDSEGNRRTYRFGGEYDQREVSVTDVTTYNFTVTTVKSSLYISKGKAYLKYDDYGIERKCYEKRRERVTVQGTELSGGPRYETTETERDLELPDSVSEEDEIKQDTARVINEQFKGVWFSLNHEVDENKNIPDFSGMTEEEAAAAYDKLSDKQKEDLQKATIEVMFGDRISEMGKTLSKSFLDIADNTATSYAFFGAYLASENAKFAGTDGKKAFKYSTTYSNGKRQGYDEYIDFALAFLQERNFYNREKYEAEQANYKEYMEQLAQSDEEEYDGYKRKDGSVYYETPHGTLVVDLIKPTAPTLSYEISGGVDYTGESSTEHLKSNGDGTYTTYEYKTTKKYAFEVNESVTIKNIGNVQVVAPSSVDTDLFDVMYPIMKGIMGAD